MKAGRFVRFFILTSVKILVSTLDMRVLTRYDRYRIGTILRGVLIGAE